MTGGARAGAAVLSPRRSLLSLGLLSLCVSGCAMHGPDAMRASRVGYNEAVRVSDQRELLLNLVRLRYTESPEFLAVSGISTQMRFDAAVSVAAAVGEEGGDDVALVSPGASVGYSESPTITFTPQRDQEFTRQLVAPIELDSIHLLSRYGWGLDRVLALIAEEINGVPNAVSRETDTAAASDVAAFLELTATLRRLEAERLIRVDVQRRREALAGPISEEHVSADDVLNAVEKGYRLDYRPGQGYVVTGERAHYVLAVDQSAWDRPEFQSLGTKLGLPPRREFYDIDAAGGDGADALTLSTRSVLGAMAYLSNAVAVPDEHIARVGSNAGVDTALRRLMEIRVSEQPVEDAFAAVEHRGNWFYIDDRDVSSKRTLGLLNSLVRLSITAGGAQNVPILTLPVAR